MTVEIESDIKISNDPLATLLNSVIAVTDPNGLTIRGRLIKIDSKVIWLEKISGDACLIAKDDIVRLWRTREVKAAV